MPTKKRKKRRKPPTVTVHMNATILAIDANFDPITKAPFDYREENIYPLFVEKGFTIVRRQGESARRTEVAAQARKPNVVYLTGVGHGFPNSYTGDNLDPIFSVGNFSPEEAAGKIVHFLSCETAAGCTTSSGPRRGRRSSAGQTMTGLCGYCWTPTGAFVLGHFTSDNNQDTPKALAIHHHAASR